MKTCPNFPAPNFFPNSKSWILTPCSSVGGSSTLGAIFRLRRTFGSCSLFFLFWSIIMKMSLFESADYPKSGSNFSLKDSLPYRRFRLFSCSAVSCGFYYGSVLAAELRGGGLPLFRFFSSKWLRLKTKPLSSSLIFLDEPSDLVSSDRSTLAFSILLSGLLVLVK